MVFFKIILDWKVFNEKIFKILGRYINNDQHIKKQYLHIYKKRSNPFNNGINYEYCGIFFKKIQYIFGFS